MPGRGQPVATRDRAPRSPWCPSKSQSRLIEWLERVVGQRFLGPIREARHALRIAKTLIPARLIFANAAALFLLAKEKGVTKNRASCFCWESV